MLNPEIKINTNNKLQQIDDEITETKKTLEDFKNSDNPDSQYIEALKLKLKELQRERLKIINETKSCLAWKKVWKEEIRQVQANLWNTNLSWEEKKQVQKVIESWDIFGSEEIEFGGIIWIIIAILEALFYRTWNLWEYAEVDANWVEIPWTRKKSKEVTSKNKEEFISNFKEIAKRIEKEYKIPWQVVISQAWLESAWGTSLLASKYNNYFGIKTFWKGSGVRLMTKENEWWRVVDKLQEFRVYSNIEDSFRDYAIFLTTNPRYKNAFNYSNDPKKFALEIANAWYATDISYASKLTSTMKWIA